MEDKIEIDGTTFDVKIKPSYIITYTQNIDIDNIEEKIQSIFDNILNYYDDTHKHTERLFWDNRCDGNAEVICKYMKNDNVVNKGKIIITKWLDENSLFDVFWNMDGVWDSVYAK